MSGSKASGEEEDNDDEEPVAFKLPPQSHTRDHNKRKQLPLPTESDDCEREVPRKSVLVDFESQADRLGTQVKTDPRQANKFDLVQEMLAEDDHIEMDVRGVRTIEEFFRPKYNCQQAFSNMMNTESDMDSALEEPAPQGQHESEKHRVLASEHEDEASSERKAE